MNKLTEAEFLDFYSKAYGELTDKLGQARFIVIGNWRIKYLPQIRFMHEIFPTNPFQSMLHIGTRTRYVPVEGLKGVSDEGEMVSDNVYIKREQKYDRRKFGKLYIYALYELD